MGFPRAQRRSSETPWHSQTPSEGLHKASHTHDMGQFTTTSYHSCGVGNNADSDLAVHMARGMQTLKGFKAVFDYF